MRDFTEHGAEIRGIHAKLRRRSPCLRIIDKDCFPKRLSDTESRQDQQQVRDRYSHKMDRLISAVEQEDKDQRENKYGLLLESKRNGEAHNTEDGSPAQRKINCEDGKGCIDTVALSPYRTVQKYSRQTEH